MHIPEHWARAEHRFDGAGQGRVVVWRWSDSSLGAAAEAAQRRLAELLAAIAEGRRPAPADYGLERPMREERLERHPAAGDEPWAVVTRNATGVAVLNTAGVPFADVDFHHLPGPGLLAALKRLVGWRPPPVEVRALARVRAWAAATPGARLRVYRTRAGLRVLRLDRLLEPRSAEARAFLAALGSDPLYARLCEVQGCFRARLTPKPYRLRLKRIPHEWPPAGAAEAGARDGWLEAYRARCQGVATCHLVEELGRGEVLPEAARVRDLHDRAALGFATAKLA